MNHHDSHNGAGADLALATYLEPLVRGRRVLLVDRPDSALVPHLAALADAVQVVPADELRIVGSHADAELELAFDDEHDLVWVADVAGLPDPRARAIDAFRNALGPDGALVLCAAHEGEDRPRRRRSRGGRPGDGLRKLASQAFDEVLLLTETAFSGFALDAPEAPDEGTALDQSLVRKQDVAPLWHVAVAAERLPALEARLVVRVPAQEAAAEADAGPRVVELEERVALLEREADELRVEARELDDELERALTRAERAEKAADVIERELDDLVRRRRQDRDDLDRAREQVRGLERELEKTRRRAADPEELQALRDEVQSLEERLVETGARVVDLEAEVERRGEIARDLMIDLERAREETAEETAAERLDESDEQILVAAELQGSSLLGRDSERVRAMGAELLTYRQHANERDVLVGQLEQAEAALRVERARALGMQMRLEEAERALERVDADGATSEELSELHEAMDGSETRVRELSRSLAEAQRRVDDLQRQAARLGEGDPNDTAERETLARELTEAQQRAADLEQALRESDDTLEALRAELRRQEEGLEKTRRERDQAREGLAEARAMLQQVAALEPPSN